MFKFIANLALVVGTIMLMYDLGYFWRDWEFWAMFGLILGTIVNNSRLVWR